MNHETSHEIELCTVFEEQVGRQPPDDLLALLRALQPLLEELAPDRWSDEFQALFNCFPPPGFYRLQIPIEIAGFTMGGCDGVTYGYLVHAPELPGSDWPIVEYCPMDSAPPHQVGRSAREFIENQLAWSYGRVAGEDAWDEDPARARLIETVAARLGFDLGFSAHDRLYGPDGNGRAALPVVPRGWAHVPTSDWIGVLAPREAFGARLPDADPAATVEEALRRAAGAPPAFALVHLREAWWQPHPERWRLGSALSEAYLALGRPKFAVAARAEAAEWERTWHRMAGAE